MMLIITQKDLSKMSKELRNELMNLIFHQEEAEPALELQSIDMEEHERLFDEAPVYEPNSDQDEIHQHHTEELVIDITPEQASALLSNLSEKSIEILKLFTKNKPIDIDSLIGEGKPYASFNELKRSFVGPVNRRLRTVTKNKSAKLFLKADSDRVTVKKDTALALKHAFENKK